MLHSGYKKSTNDVKFEWKDGMPLLYTRWGLNEPNNDAINMDPDRSCVYMDNSESSLIFKNYLILYRS